MDIIGNEIEQLVQNGLIPNPITLTAQLLSTLILFLTLKHFVWIPMQEFLQKRSDVIVDELQSAKSSNEEAQQNKDQSQIELNNAKSEALKIVDGARSQALETKETIIKEAEREALYKVQKAEKEIEQERAKAEKELKARAIEIAFTAAEKLVNENVDDNKNRKMIEKFIEEVGE